MDRPQIVTDPVGRRVATVYDLAGNVLYVWRGWNSATPPTTSTSWNPATYTGMGPVRYAGYTYGANGEKLTELDANGNLTSLVYDGFNRLFQLQFPSATLGAGTSNTSDYEQYGFDANDNELSIRKRDGQVISFTFDQLNRRTLKDLPGTTSGDVYFGYDLAGRPTYARFGSVTGSGIVYGFDSARRVTSETNSLSSPSRVLGYSYDLGSNRIQITWPDGNYSNYDIDALNRVYKIRENGASSGLGVLVTYTLDPLSRVSNIARGNGVSSSLGYDSASRLQSLSHTPTGSGQSLTLGFGYTLASQLKTRTSSNALYDWIQPGINRSYTPDGLNRYSSVSGGSYAYDARGNMTSDGARTFSYDVENRLTSVVGGAGLTLTYDPLGRLWQTTSGSTLTQFLYDGANLVGEYSSSGTVLRRFVHGPKTDEPIVWYEGATMTSRNWLHADERGSIIATTDGSGNATIYTYGAYGEPTSWTGPRFRYTGQAALPEAQLYHYKARVYDPIGGRFLQIDPIGTKDDFNLYAYVGNDPANGLDPTGTLCVWGVNSWNDFCQRSYRYEAVNADQRIASQTSFFGAAAVVTNALGGWWQSEFMHQLSSSLERANMARADQIRTGTLYSSGSVRQNTADFVHFEQGLVQQALDKLQASNPSQYAEEVGRNNSILNGPFSAVAKATDPTFARAAAATRNALGRDIDFAKQGDREALGNAVAKEVEKNRPLCTGTRLEHC